MTVTSIPSSSGVTVVKGQPVSINVSNVVKSQWKGKVAAITLAVLAPRGIMGVLFPTARVGPAERFGRFMQQTFRRRLGGERY